MQLGFAVWPLLRFTGDRAKMGRFVNPPIIKLLGWTTALDHHRAERQAALRHLRARIVAGRRLRRVTPFAGDASPMYRRILVALDHTKADESLLPHVTALARADAAPSSCSSTSPTAGRRATTIG